MECLLSNKVKNGEGRVKGELIIESVVGGTVRDKTVAMF
jgi:hypothetical protein